MQKYPLWVVFFTVFVDMLGYGILLPIIPLLLADPHSPDYLLPGGVSIKQGYILLGFLTAAFPLGQFLATPILGQLSDKFGRRRLLAFSLAGTCLSYIIFAIGIITKNIPLLFVARAFDGITGGNISVAQAAVADVTTPQTRAKNFGLIGAAFGLGFIIGPFVGGKLSDPSVVSWFSASTPFWFAALLSFLNVMSVLLFFPETLKTFRDHLKIDWIRSVQNIGHAYTMKKLRVIFLTSFLFNSGFTFFNTFFSVYLINKFHYTQGNLGDFFSYIGIWVVVTQALVTRKLSHMFPEYKIIRITLMGLGITTLLYFLPTHWWQNLFIVPIFAVCIGLTIANMTALVSRSADASVQGEVLGISSSVQALAQSIPPILSGFIASSLTPETPIFVSSMVVTVGGFIFLFFYEPHLPQHQTSRPLIKETEEAANIVV